MDRLSEDEPNVSLDFVDTDHVLLTFNRKKLFQRLPGCPPGHQDRLIHAAIIEVPSGIVIHETDWYLHDRRRYLWPMGQGKFLLRRLNDLFVVDLSLHEKLLLSSPKDLLSVSVTPDARQIIVETAKDATPPPASPTATAKPTGKFEAKFLDATTLAPLRTITLNKFVNLTGTSAGYVDLVHKTDMWLLRFGPTPTQRRNIARVRSQTVPNVFYSSDNSLVIGRCPSPSCDYSVTAFTLTGHRLWQQHWPRYRFYPSVARNEDNSRFAVGTLRLAASAAAKVEAAPNDNDDDDADIFQPDISQRDVFQQDVQVFETATGTPILSIQISPAVITGQNFSLSPDGRRLAVLEGSGLELFDLPPTSEAEQIAFSELRSGIPDPYAFASTPGTESGSSANPKPDITQSPTSPEETPANSVAAANSESDNVEDSSGGDQDSPGRAQVPKAAEQDVQATGQAPATFKVSTRAVLLDVVVTDGSGHPVKGLRKQDFQVIENGKAQAVRSFQEFSDGYQKEAPTTETPAVPPKAATKSPNVFSNKSHAPDVGAVTLVLFDMLNTPAQDQSFARQQLIKFLASKPKNLQFALCTMSAGASPLRLIQGFTPDETLLLAAVKGKKGIPKEASWQVSMAGTTNAIDTVTTLAQEGPTSGFQGLLGALQQTQAEQQVTDTSERSAITLDSMMLLAQYLSGIAGRKNIVWLSGSFPIAISATTNSGDLALDNPNYTYKIKRVTNLLAESQIAVYPVDVRGLLGAGLSAASAGAMGGPTSIDPQDFSASSAISPSPAIPQDMQALAQQAAERDTLLQFATATGGKAFFNTNGVREAIATATEQGSNYYAFSYSPANKNYDGKFRKIKVQIEHKGYKLLYRQGYYADDARTTARDVELARRTRAAAMQHGSPLSHQLQFSVTMFPVGHKTKIDRSKLGAVVVASGKQPALPAQVEAQHYGIDYSLDGSELRFMSLQNATYRNTLTLMVASFDRDGNMLTGISSLGTRDLPAAEYEKVVAGEFGIQQEVDLPAEAASLRIGIQDQMSNRLGTVDIPLPLPVDPDAPRQVKNSLPEIEPD